MSIQSDTSMVNPGEPGSNDSDILDVVIVGGGVGGLYCAAKLAGPKQTVVVLEALGRLGGRIETVMMEGFQAEFGPMRFEKVGQPLLMQLLADLKLTTVEFKAYGTENPQWPHFDEPERKPSGERLSALQLLKLGILRLLKSPGHRDDPDDVEHTQWLRQQGESEYAAFRKHAEHGGQRLHAQGLWNALGDVLSHQAVLKIRVLGNFYHLLPDNPNAIEWIIFWLRGFHPDDGLVGIKEGTESLIERLTKRVLERKAKILTGHRLVTMSQADDGVVTLGIEGATKTLRARHVILALQQSALVKLAHQLPTTIRDDLAKVMPIPLLKCFFVTSHPWWTGATKPQTNASLMPTREVHYYRREGSTDGMVMVYCDHPALRYWTHYVSSPVQTEAELDAPGLKARFLKYLARDIGIKAKADHERLVAAKADPAVLGATEGLAIDREFLVWLADTGALPPRDPGADALDEHLLALDALARLDPEQLVNLLEPTLKKSGIRDWGRPPFQAACHAWVPGAESWEVIARMKAFALRDGKPASVHICGEAYSDYQGFIEGALRTAGDVLKAIGGSDEEDGAR